MKFKVTKVNELTLREMKILEMLIICNFNKVQAFETLYPDRIMESKEKKTRHFEHMFQHKREQVYEYIDNFYKEKFRKLNLSKERILTDIMDTIDLARRSGDIKNTLAGYKLLADLMGLHITKAQIDVNQTSLILHYHTEQKNNDLISGNTLLSITETGSSMENNQ